MTTDDVICAVYHLAESLTFVDLEPGKVPGLLLTFKLGPNDEVLRRTFGAAFDEAVAASIDDVVKVRVLL